MLFRVNLTFPELIIVPYCLLGIYRILFQNVKLSLACLATLFSDKRYKDTKVGISVLETRVPQNLLLFFRAKPCVMFI